MTLQLANKTITFLIIAAWLAAIFFHGTGVKPLLFTWSLVIIASAMALIMLPRQIVLVPYRPLAITLLLFSCWLFLSLSWSVAPSLSILTASVIACMPVVFFLYHAAGIDNRNWQQLGHIILLIAVGLSLHVVWQALEGDIRPGSVFLNRNSLAALLSMAIFLVAGRFLLYKDTNFKLVAYATGIFILSIAIALTVSRGASLSLLVALLLMLAITFRHIDSRKAIIVYLLVISGLFLPGFFDNFSIGSRLDQTFTSVIERDNVEHSRVIIWQQSWELIKQSPWVGHGFGLFWLVYPQVRNPMDGSSGFYVHNDFMQIWLEAGLPALILLIAVLVSTLLLYLRIMKSRPGRAVIIEASSLFFALLAIVTHTLFTFNFYILSILILIGLFLGRLSQLGNNEADNKSLLPFQLRINIPVLRISTVTLAGILLYNILLIGLGDHYHRQALTLHHYERFDLSDNAYKQSRRFHESDRLLTSHASLYQKLLAKLPVSQTGTRTIIYQDALKLINDAVQINPLSDKAYLVKGLLLTTNPDLAGDGSVDMAYKAFTTALRFNPRNHDARVGASKLLEAKGNISEALELLEAGISEKYANTNIRPYLAYTLKLRLRAGDRKGAEQIARLIRYKQGNDQKMTIEKILAEPDLVD